MMYFRPIVKFIETEASLTLGTNLFSGFIPQSASDTDIISVVTNQAGSELEPLLPDRANMIIEVLTRGIDYVSVEEAAYDIFNIIHTRYDMDLPVIVSGETYKFMVGHGTTTPRYIGQDERRRHLFSTVYVFMLREKE